MKGDFTRFTHEARKHYTRVLKQQGRVDLDADWNEAVEIFTQRDRIEAIDVIGRAGAPLHDDGFKVEATADGSGLTMSPGRIWVDGILCEQEGPDSVPLTEQEDLPGYELPDEDGVYLAYLDVWDRHITYLEDPDIREVALGGPDTTTRTRTICQVRLLRIAGDESLDLHECQPYPASPSTGLLSASAAAAGDATNPCAVPEGAGYTGLENRLYRVEIHDDGRDEDGVPGARPVTFKWSRDNGSVVLPIADENGIDGDTVSLERFGFDEVLTVRVGDWVEILGDATELYGRPGTLGQIVPDGIDRADLEVELDRDVSAHAAETHLKMRRWDHHETDDLTLIDGALPIPAGPFELEDGVFIELTPGGTYHVGDYWVIPARTREGAVLWPREGTAPVPLPPLGIHHHYCTLALARRTGGVWTEPRDCRPLFPPLTEVGDGGCCLRVEAGGDLQQAIDTVVAAGGGCISLCEGVHVSNGPLWIREGADVCLHGEGAATTLLFAGTDDFGRGGLVIEGGQRIAVEDLFIASSDAPALVSVMHGPELVRTRQVALRRLLLLNLTESDAESDLTCGVRLGHAEGVWLDACRIAAEVGILSLWGDTLRDTNGEPGEPGEGNGAPPVIILGFEGPGLGSEIRVGDSVSESGVTITGAPFQWGNGVFTENGFARVEGDGDAGGSGQDVQVNNINLEFGLPAAYAFAQVTFGEFGGNVNLRINGDLQNVGNFTALNNVLVGGVRVSVVMAAGDPRHGLLRLDAETSDIAELAIGGQELWIDDVTFRDPADAPAEPVLDYGDGVEDLRMRDTVVRFQDAGLLVALAERWQIDRADVRPYDEESWGEVRERFEAREEGEGAGPSARSGAVLSALEDVFAGAGAPRGHALLAFRWHGCAVRHSTIAGTHGLRAWWWLGGDVQGNLITGEESGSHGFWLHESDWSGNEVSTSDGIGLSFAGCCRVRFEHNRLRGPIGVTNLPFLEALDGLETLASALLRGYGPSAADLPLVVGTMLHESFELMGLGPLLEALQPVIDEESPTPGVPVAYYLADGFLDTLRARGESGFLRALPVIDLSVSHNDVACGLQGVALDGFLVLGSLRVSDNRIHTTSGQAVRIVTNPFYANAHLTVLLFRTLLSLLVRLVENVREDTEDGRLADVLAALETLLMAWQQGAESLFDLDFRVEGNTVRSLRTAIESNLFELAVLTNHVTMQERTLVTVPPQAAGQIFGRVRSVAGTLLAQASVRAVGTERVAFTDQSASYQLIGLPAGTYTVRATLPGFGVSTATVTVGAGEQVEVNFVLAPQSRSSNIAGAGFSDASVGARQALARVGNVEIVEVIEALESSAALEALAVALREGADVMPEAYAGFLAADAGPLATAPARAEAANAASVIQGQASDPELRLVSGQLSTALRANDRTQLSALFARFIRALQRFTDSQGILLQGVGGRIVENHVLVPVDARQDTEALGGIQVSVNLAYVVLFSVLGTFLARYLGGDQDDEAAIDPLLDVTDTLVENNEVVGGIGHGISVQGVAGQPDFVRDLRVRGNQVRGSGGAGVFVNEHALVIGLDVSHNHVSGCGRAAGFTQRKGGVVVHGAAVCAIQGNQVLRCGEALQEDNAYGVDLDSLYGLRLADNDIQANGSAGATADDGGVRLVEVYGSVLVNDNVVAFNRGLGLSWVNSARTDEPALLPAFLMQAVNAYLRMSRTVTQLVQEEQASLQGNVLKSVADSDFPVFQLLNLREVQFSGNTCYAETRGAPLGEIQQAERGIISHNLTQTNSPVAIGIKKLAAGVVLGNVGNRPIQLQASASVQHNYNVPPVS